MKIIGVATENFQFYYDVVEELKQRDIPFASLSPTDDIPDNIEVIITTEKEREGIDFKNVVGVSGDVRKGVRKALSVLSSDETYNRMVVGIDPGVKPGLALVADEKVLETAYAQTPEAVKSLIMKYLEGYEFQEMVVRIGHGDKTNRNRTINSLKDLPVRIEIVNEEDTTHQGLSPDLQAAKEIAFSHGQLVQGLFEVEATEGEMREIQRRSRIKSDSEITISKDLAKRVVEGELNLEEAIKEQKEGD